MIKEGIQKLTFKIADIVLSLENTGVENTFLKDNSSSLSRFISEGSADFVLEIRRVSKKDMPYFSIAKTVFDSGETWSFYQCADKKFLLIDDSSLEGQWETAVLVEPDFSRGVLYQDKEAFSGEFLANPLGYPVDQALMINLLAQGKGVLSHGCGIDYQGKGILFTGSSGKGKTTLADLFYKHTRANILNDDRIIIRDIAGVFRIYGTPWHGTGKYACPESAALSKIYFLNHAKENSVIALGEKDAASRLVTLLFAPCWSKEGMDFSLKICAQLAARVPCSQLNFVPRKSAVDMIKNEMP
ncbi:MAG: hypothetical protein HY810_03535 [Candidatus Omnitrophica bacterium]|nr:hypothetical protein [Candidatus Omnitrophota bacterium]